MMFLVVSIPMKSLHAPIPPCHVLRSRDHFGPFHRHGAGDPSQDGVLREPGSKFSRSMVDKCGDMTENYKNRNIWIDK